MEKLPARVWVPFRRPVNKRAVVIAVVAAVAIMVAVFLLFFLLPPTHGSSNSGGSAGAGAAAATVAMASHTSLRADADGVRVRNPRRDEKAGRTSFRWAEVQSGELLGDGNRVLLRASLSDGSTVEWPLQAGGRALKFAFALRTWCPQISAGPLF